MLHTAIDPIDAITIQKPADVSWHDVPISPHTAPRTWLFGDYNQAESRGVAWKAPVPKLRQWYHDGVDVHSYVAQLIARVVQQNKIQTPINNATGKPLFWSVAPEEHNKKNTPEERDTAKRTVHGSNYDMGPAKMALVLGVSEQFARTLYTIYHTLFPEIKGRYHAWVRQCLMKSRTIWMPEPVKFRKVFHDINAYAPLDDETLRSAYSCYPQCIVGALLVRTLDICCNIFRHRDGVNGKYSPVEELKDQWCAWYGKENWDEWLMLCERGIRTPKAILWGGMDVRLNVHDAGGISIPNDDDLMQWAARTWKQVGEVEINISDDPQWGKLVIPIDFKSGPTMSGDDLKDFKIAA